MKRFFRVALLPASLILFLLLMLLFPNLALEGAKTGLLLWFQKVLPSLLPFMILSNLLTETGSVRSLTQAFSPLCSKMGLNAGLFYPLFAGLFCGYPMGAKACADSFEEGSLSKGEAGRLLPCCNLPSPMFLTGYLCTGLFSLSAPKRTLTLLAVYLPLPLLWLLGGIFLPKGEKKAAEVFIPRRNPALLPALEASMLKSFEVVEKIGGYMILFSILSLFLTSWLPKHPAALLLAGSLEMTSGAHMAAKACSLPLSLSMAIFFTVSGGLCITAQTGSVIRESGLSLPAYFAMKLLHGAISALLLFFLF